MYFECVNSDINYLFRMYSLKESIRVIFDSKCFKHYILIRNHLIR